MSLSQKMTVPLKTFLCMGLSLFALLPSQAVGQTFEINGQPSSTQNGKAIPKARKGEKQSSSEPSAGLGWGSSIAVGRMSRAAEDALKKGNYAAAAEFAQRGVQAAPQDSRLWFLLGYTSRMAGHYQQSLDAYHRGLQSNPSSADGLSGLAQTYAKAGNVAEAKQILLQVISAHPDRVQDMLIAGELDIQTNDLEGGLSLLQRAEAKKPSSHAELLMALAYMRLKQPEKAKGLLEQAKRRDPRNVEIFRAVANYFRETRDYASAITTLKNAPRKTPDVLADLGFTYELAGEMKQAAATYAQAANAEPKNIHLQLSAAQADVTLGDVNKANSFLQRAESLDANHYRLHAIRANIDRLQNRPADAIGEYNFALSHLPQGTVPEGQLFPVLLRLNLSELYKDTGDQAAAQREVAEAEREISGIQVEGPQKAEFLRVRASIRAGGNDFAGAENDLKEALALDPANTNVYLQYANLLWKTERKDQARKMYSGVLERDPRNRYALEAMGYLERDSGNTKIAEQYFNRLAADYPDDYVPYLALGDMYTSLQDFRKAGNFYEKAHQRAPGNATVIANAANAAIEEQNFKLAKTWLDRASGAMNDDPAILRQRERYLFHSGDYIQSARLGYRVLEKIPNDRNASVYLGYDLYNLGRYEDLLALTTKFEPLLPKEPNFPLLAGHVHRQSGLLDQSVDDMTRAIERDPKMTEAYVVRGFVENDLQRGGQAAKDFDTALKLAPKNGIAHLGLAFADLQLRHGKASLEEADEAARLLGESASTHLARAGADRQMRALSKAEKEYRLALKASPKDEKLHLALADTLYQMGRYNDSLNTLKDALQLQPPLEERAEIYASMAHAAAHLRRREETLHYVASAEQADNSSSSILLNTGEALLELGDRQAAMDRFALALNAPDADRVEARLAIARLFVREGKWDDAKQQVALAFAEARVGEASPVTADNLIEAANIFLNIQDFDLARRYFGKAREAGAGDEASAVGMANAYLAVGDSRGAQAELASLGSPADHADSYDYNLALGNVYRQRHDNPNAIAAFARANQLSSESNDIAERELMETSGDQGMQITQHVSFLSDILTHALFDDPTIYQLDAKLLHATPATLPRPRWSQESMLTNLFKYDGVPGLPVHGFFQIRDAIGQTSLPSEELILSRNTHDYNFNAGVAPTLHLGRNSISLDFGLQTTLRRDTFDRLSAFTMNQNLFRQYLYLSTNSIGNWLAVRGEAYHEAGPFTERDLHSRDLGTRLEFELGRPWAKTAVITGYAARDLLFRPIISEFFTTSTYGGVERKFGQKVKVTALAEYVRSWRVQNTTFAIAQAIQPGARFEITPNNHWAVDGSFTFARGEGFHAYDNTQGGFFISYSKPLHRNIMSGAESLSAEYPLRFSIGLQEQEFFNFTGRDRSQLRPVVRLTLF